MYDAAVQLRGAWSRGEWLLFLDNGPGEPHPYREDRNLRPGVGTRISWGGTGIDMRATLYGGMPPGDSLWEGAGILTLHLERNPWTVITEAGERRRGRQTLLRVALGELYYTVGAWTPFLRAEILEQAGRRDPWVGAGLNWSAREALVIKLEVNRWIHTPRTRAGVLMSVAF